MKTLLGRSAIAAACCLVLTGCGSAAPPLSPTTDAATPPPDAAGSGAPTSAVPKSGSSVPQAGSGDRLDVTCAQFRGLSEDEKTTTIRWWRKARGITNPDMPEYVAVGRDVMSMGAYCSQPEHDDHRLANLYLDPGQR